MTNMYKNQFLTLILACMAVPIYGGTSLAQRCRSSNCCCSSGSIDLCCTPVCPSCCDNLAPMVGSASDSPMAGGLGGAMDAAGQPIEPTPPGEAEWESIFISVTVPEDAKVTVNGKPTVSEGKTRQFVIRALEPGKKYKFVISAETVNSWGIVMQDSKTLTPVTGTREVLVLTPVRIRKKSDAPAKAPDIITAKDVQAQPADKT